MREKIRGDASIKLYRKSWTKGERKKEKNEHVAKTKHGFRATNANICPKAKTEKPRKDQPFQKGGGLGKGQKLGYFRI